MPTGFGVAEQINRIVEKYSLGLKKIIRIGPRFFIGLYEKSSSASQRNPSPASLKRNNKKVLLKVSFGHARESYNFKRICKKLNRESKFLDLLARHRDPILKEAVPKLVDFETTGRSWHLKKYIEAEPQNLNKSNFLFQKSFFNDKSSTFLAQFFSHLHQASKDFPSSFKKMVRKYPLKNHERCIHYFIILDNYEMSHLKERFKKFLESKREIFDKNQNVLTHFEAYAPHILKDKDSKFYFIDWENVSWGNPVRDITTIWMRGFNHPDWQKDLIEKFLSFSLPKHKKYFKDLFEVEVILQSISNMGYFKWTRDKDELKTKNRALEFFITNAKKALGEKLL